MFLKLILYNFLVEAIPKKFSLFFEIYSTLSMHADWSVGHEQLDREMHYSLVIDQWSNKSLRANLFKIIEIY